MTTMKTAVSRLRALLALLWSISFGAVRDFVWADLRDGIISPRGLSGPVRALITLGFAFLAGILGVLLFSGQLRAASPLIPLSYSGYTVGRGALLPTLLAPLTWFMLALAWSFVLTGALHAHWLLRVGGLALYFLLFFDTLVTGLIEMLAGFSSLLDLVSVALAAGALAAVPFFFMLRWRARPRPVLEFTVLFLCISATLALTQAQEVQVLRETGTPLGLINLEKNLSALRSLALPLLVLIGVDIAKFTWQAAGWTTEVIALRLPRWSLFAALALVSGWRVVTVVGDLAARAADGGWGLELPGYAGALGELVVTAVVWWLVMRLARPHLTTAISDEQVVATAERLAIPLVLLNFGVLLINLAILILIPFVFIIGQLFVPGWLVLFDRLQQATDFMLSQTENWRLLIVALTFGVGLWLARRGRRLPALYLLLVGGLAAWWEVTDPGRPFAALDWRGPEPSDFWWVLALTAVAIFWLWRRQLTAERARRLLLLFLITGLLRQTDFIEDPFSPFLAFAGIGFVAFGILWDALTIGWWANQDTPRLPRLSRIFLYVGYVLLTVTVINWSLVTHDLTSLERFTGDMALLGLDSFGRPMLYALFPLLLVESEYASGE